MKTTVTAYTAVITYLPSGNDVTVKATGFRRGANGPFEVTEVVFTAMLPDDLEGVEAVVENHGFALTTRWAPTGSREISAQVEPIDDRYSRA